jgi:predicted Zn-dependent peptidase
MDYRLLWAALNSGGYQAVLLRSAQNPQAILSQLQQLITEERVENSQNQLASQWQERMRDLQNQIQAMNLIAYYDLPTSTMQDYVEQIQDQDIEQVIKLAQDALNSQPISHPASAN